MGKDIVDSFSNLELSEKDALIATLIEETRNLRDTVTKLETQVNHEKNSALPYYSSGLLASNSPSEIIRGIPQQGLPAKFVAENIENAHLMDFNPRLNTSSYVNVVSEEEERKVALMGLEVK